MNRDTQTVYSNIATLKLTPNEFVLEFGAHFPDAPKQGEVIAFVPPNFVPSIRVVMPASSLVGLHQALGQAVKQKTELDALLLAQPVAKAQ